MEPPPAARLLVVPRDDVEPASRFGFANAEVVALPGAAHVLRDPHEAEAPDALLDGIADWLAARLPEDVVPPRRVPASPRVQMPSAGSASELVEEASFFGPGQRLFGVITEAVAREASACAVFLNAGATPHVGMNRNYVMFARALAMQGVASLRFDVSGLGDSLPRSDGYENLLYSPEVVPDVRAALDFLERERGLGQFVLIGLCAGAYAAFHTALADSRVRGAVMINPQTFDFKPGDSLDVGRKSSFKAARWYRRSLLRKESWQKALRGDVDVLRVAGVLAGRLRDVGREKLAEVSRRSAPPSRIAQRIEQLCERGTRLLFVYSADDPGREVLRQAVGRELPRLLRRPELELRIIAGADHTFTPLSSQLVLREHILAHFVTAHGARADKESAPRVMMNVT